MSDVDRIRNVIARVAISFDRKDWEMLKTCLTEDCKTAYPEPFGTFDSSKAIAEKIQSAINHLVTCHALSTQTVELTAECQARATTYCTASHYFGEKSFVATGRYDDLLVKQTVDGVETWLIRDRMVSDWLPIQGDVSILG